RHRGTDKTICPSDVARTVGGPGWRALMQPVRDVSAQLAALGTVELRQRGKVVDAASARGPIRIALR
ncbi:MAG: S-adenosylmethionine:tRNA-ribosyltransferase-isomerase, partial [Myxococcaceae bacterium]|nr:S-adenosylmethionine:tRNA-ribosyltransferase-isomerase [Myxococcaceae bacterium]